MAMTTCDYVVLTRALNKVYTNNIYLETDHVTFGRVVDSICDELAKDNPRFNRGIFRQVVYDTTKE